MTGSRKPRDERVVVAGLVAPDAGSQHPGNVSIDVSRNVAGNVLPQPHLVVTLLADGTGTVDGRPVHLPPGTDRHLTLMTEACRRAAALERPVRVTARDEHTEWDLVAHPDGAVTALGDGRPRSPAERRRPPRRPPLPRVRPPGLHVVGGLVIGCLLIAALAVVPMPDAEPTAPERVVATVTAGFPAPTR